MNTVYQGPADIKEDLILKVYTILPLCRQINRCSQLPNLWLRFTAKCSRILKETGASGIGIPEEVIFELSSIQFNLENVLGGKKKGKIWWRTGEALPWNTNRMCEWPEKENHMKHWGSDRHVSCMGLEGEVVQMGVSGFN